MLNTLKAYGVRANFFSVGRPASVWPDRDRAELAEGHITGSHTKTHPDLARLDMKSAEAEILDGRRIVAGAAGEAIPFFRFPYGSHNAALDAFVKAQGMTSFLWNMDSSDWKIPDPTALFHNEVSQLDRAKGGIMLMHDIHQQTAIALPHLLDELRHRGWKTVVFVPH
jgi:peptidoglycan/xylan/chitin deacetylase (PgdA/CDA1 family)